jgi:hypothetical protein
MKHVPCARCGQSVPRAHRITNAICPACRNKERNDKQKLETKLRKRCEICYKYPKCPTSAHIEINNWLYYMDGKAYLSKDSEKTLGENYLEKLREKNVLSKM